MTKPSTAALVAAFGIVYVVWGSTYLGIRYAIETIPPLLMAGIRFATAGGILLLVCRVTGAPKPDRAQLKNAFIAGALMLCFANGTLAWAEKRIPTGIAALLVSCVPLWLLLLNWRWGTRLAPTSAQVLGLLIGFGGIALLMIPSNSVALGKSVDIVGSMAVVLCSLSWALGTMHARQSEMPANPWMANGIEMFGAGLLLIVVGLAVGERINVHAVTLRSALGIGYLIVFGSLVAFSAYTWLNQATTPARLSTYAYVNPVVAVLLGRIFLGEPITGRALSAMLLILVGVLLLSFHRKMSAAV